MRDILKPAVSLFIIAAIAAVLLGYVHYITEEPIAEASLNATKESMDKVIPDVSRWGDIIDVNEGEISSYAVAMDSSGNTVGYAISVETVGFGAGLKLMYGIDTDGNITGLEILDCSNETPGLGANAKNDDFRSQFAGKTGGELAVAKDGGDIDALTGATITSRAVTNAANTAADFFKTLESTGGEN